MAEILLALVPLLLLLGCLLLGHYPGCEAILRLAARIASPRAQRPAKRELRPPAPDLHVASGGLLIALGIAQRPPPLTP